MSTRAEQHARNSPASVRHRRIGEIDALRGIAALMVILYHYTVIYDGAFGHASGFWFSFEVGRLGVELFFMISGFVILMTLDRARTASDFVLARASRLYPVYWLSVLLTAAAVTAFSLPGFEVTPGQVLANLTMFQTFLGVKNVDGVYWTMAVELVFYGWMLLALACRLLLRIEAVAAIWLSALLVVVMLFAVFDIHLSWAAATALLLYYSHLFLAGMLFYRLRAGWSLLTVELIAVTFVVEAMIHPGSIVIVGGWYLVFALLVADRLTFLNRRPLLFLGSISYPLYLLHENLGFIVIRQLYAWGVGDTLVLIVAPLTLSVALATCVHRAVEVPAQRWIRNWSRKQSLPSPLASDSAVSDPAPYNAPAPPPGRVGSWPSPASATTSKT